MSKNKRTGLCGLAAAIGVSLFVAGRTFADVRLPAIISDNMVLQQQSEAVIWGWADPGESVSVRGSWPLALEVCSQAGEDGKWMARVKTPQAGRGQSLTIRGKNEIIVGNILIGEVWLCAGQSNMGMSVLQVNDERELDAADWPEIRLFNVARNITGEPQEECGGRWVLCSPAEVGGFSAVAYFFGRELHQKLHVPVGLVQVTWGGTPAECWMPHETLTSNQDFSPILERFAQDEKEYPARLEAYEENPKGAPPVDPQKNYLRPSGLYNGMIAPLMPFTIKGTIWYQGESNSQRAYQYRTLFPALVGSWRQRWGQGDFPFYYVQIAPFRYTKKWPDWISYELREAQRLALSVVPNSGMVVTMDIGKAEDLHPKDKLSVGRRLALWALAKDYGFSNLVYSGPLYKSSQVEGDKIRLYFDHVGSGLVAKDGPLTHFTIASDDRVFKEAVAEINGDSIIVSSPAIKRPAAVRYGWSDDAMPNLFNCEGLPASPFRTDNWESLTQGKF